MELPTPDPLPSNQAFALLGGTCASMAAVVSVSHLGELALCAAIGATVSYFTGYALKRLMKDKER